MTLQRRPFSSVWEDDAGRTYLEYKFPLRSDLDCILILPTSLSLTDARRIGRFLDTLVDVNATAGFAP